MWGKPPCEPVCTVESDDVPHQEAVMRNFARHILFGEQLLYDAASGLASLELANAITLSNSLGREVALPINRTAYDALLTELQEKSTSTKREGRAMRVTDPKFAKR